MTSVASPVCVHEATARTGSVAERTDDAKTWQRRLPLVGGPVALLDRTATAEVEGREVWVAGVQQFMRAGQLRPPEE